jgi:hypothetical protein
VPLNFRFTADDIKYCASVAEPQLFIFGEEFTDRLTGIRGEIPAVQHYICVGKNIPTYAESFAAHQNKSWLTRHLLFFTAT